MMSKNRIYLPSHRLRLGERNDIQDGFSLLVSSKGVV